MSLASLEQAVRADTAAELANTKAIEDKKLQDADILGQLKQIGSQQATIIEQNEKIIPLLEKLAGSGEVVGIGITPGVPTPHSPDVK